MRTTWCDRAVQNELVKAARYGGAERERSIWYHGTRGRNLPSILSQGLVPNPKKREWQESEGSFNAQSLASLGGIYLTKNLMTAIQSSTRSVNRSSGESSVVVIVEIQPRSLLADEDQITNFIRYPVGNASEYIVTEYFMARELGTNSSLVEHGRDKYVKDCIDQIKKNRLPDMSEHVEDILKKLLHDGWDIALNRQAAYAYRAGDKNDNYSFDWKTAFWRNISEADRQRLNQKMKEYEQDGHTIEQAYKKAVFTTIPKRPDSNQAEHAFAAYSDRLTRLLKTIARKEDYFQTARIETPIGFSGKNKIICIVECFHNPGKFGDYHDRIRFAWGTPPDIFMNDWRRSVGPIRMLDGNEDPQPNRAAKVNITVGKPIFS